MALAVITTAAVDLSGKICLLNFLTSGGDEDKKICGAPIPGIYSTMPSWGLKTGRFIDWLPGPERERGREGTVK